MAYKEQDYSELDQRLEGSVNPVEGSGFGNKLIFSAKDKNNVPYKAGTKFKNIVLRVLPRGLGHDVKADVPWVELKQHFIDGKYVLCTKDSLGECAACSLGNKITRKFAVNVLVMSNSHRPETVGEVKVFEMDKNLFNELYVAMQPVEEGKAKLHPMDLIKGNDFRLSGVVETDKSGKARINWAGSEIEEKVTRIGYYVEEEGEKIRKPLTDDQIEEVLEKRHDLNALASGVKTAARHAAPAKAKEKDMFSDDEDDGDDVPKKKPSNGSGKKNFFDEG